jgi:hypothetical protein
MRKKISGEKRGVWRKKRGFGEKVENSGEKVKNSGEKKKHHFEGQMVWGPTPAEPWDRKRSPGRGPEDPGRRAAAVAAPGKEGWLIGGSSGNFIGRFLVHQQSCKCWTGLHQLGARPLNSLVSYWPRPGYCRQSYVKFTRLGWGDSDIQVNPARMTRMPIRAASYTRGKLGPRGRSDCLASVGEVRACAPPGVLTCADSDGATKGTRALTAC